MSKSALLKSSLAKKYWMAASGLFLCLFLLGHLAGNLQLFVGGEVGRLQFNEYAQFMTTNPVVKIMSYLTYFSILFHAVDGLLLTLHNRKARPVKYAKEKASANSMWSSRNMGILGTIILAFIVGHMYNFWWKMKYSSTPMPMQSTDAEGKLLETPLKDLHTIVMDFFDPAVNNLAYLALALYIIAQIAISFHLIHGFQSAWQSLGINHRKYTPIIKTVGLVFAIGVPLAFAAIPAYLVLFN